MIDNFQQLFQTLECLIGKDKSINKIMSTIFYNEYNKISNITFRKKLFEKILTNNDFILNSSGLFKKELYFESTPEKMKIVKKSILQNQNPIIKLLNNCKKEYFEQIIINLFEFKILKFFDFITTIKKVDVFRRKPKYQEYFKLYYESINGKNLNETYIIYNLAFDLFKECVTELDSILSNNENKNNNNNLYKLFAISYIKIYLDKLVYFIYHKNQIITSTKEIMDFIIGSDKNNMFRKVIKIYIFKLFFNLMKKDWNELNKFTFDKHDINFTDILTEENEGNIVKEIIEEKISPINEKYKNYPLLKYFIYTKYKNKEDFIKKLGQKEKYMKEYPLLYKYLSEDNKESNIKKLIYLPYINDFSNYMINYYSFNISREDAKLRSLRNEQIFNDEQFKIKWKRFFASWERIKDKAIKYKFHPNMEVKTLKEDDKLIYFLDDINEVGNGMYLASAYQNFINWQNEFLQYIIDNGKNKKNLDFYIESMNNKMPVYEANSNQILQINKNFEEIINNFSKRNIYNEDGTIDYLKYNEFKYDASSIEEELAKTFLTGKCLFEPDNLNLIKYWGEGFNTGKSDILEKFYKKYKQIDLNEEEKLQILAFLKAQNNKNDFKLFFGSIQLFIFYLANNNLEEDKPIKYYLNKLPGYLKIEEICNDFFNNKGQSLKAEKIMSVFFFFEHLCFKELCKNLNEKYKEKLKDELISKIQSKLLNKENLNEVFTIKELAAAVRRFISRSLVNTRIDDNIDPKKILLPYLTRPELWEEKVANVDNLEELISDLIEELNLTVGQSYEFYEKIKNEDEKEISLYEENEVKGEEEEKKTTKKK